MYDQLKAYCRAVLPFTDNELRLIDKYFKSQIIGKKGFLLQEGKVCNFLAFIARGMIRHFHIKDGEEKTCDISFENSWVTDLQSFNRGTPSIMNLQAMEETTVFTINKENLQALYGECTRYESFGRLMAEHVAQRSTEIAMSLSSEKPEERFLNLLHSQPGFFQRVPQKYIANFLGISPESLSRIRKRILTRQKS